MGDDKTTSGGLGLIGWIIIWTLIAYFVYGSVELALSVALLNVLLGITMVICVIPVIGTPLYYIVATDKIVPFVYEITSLYPTWITKWIFGMNMIIGTILWIVIMMFVVFTLFT